MCILASDRHERLSDINTSNGSLWFTVSSPHSGLETIGSGTRQHFVDTDNVEGVDSYTDVECILTSNLGHVLVGTDTSRFESFRRQLFVLIGHQIHTLGELINVHLFLTEIEDSDLWDGN